MTGRKREREGTSSDEQIQSQISTLVDYERRMAERRLKRLLATDDFIDFLYETITQVCGVEMSAPRDRGELALARFEGGRDVGIALRDRCIEALPDSWARGVQRRMKAVKERAEKIRDIETKARRGQKPSEPQEIP